VTAADIERIGRRRAVFLEDILPARRYERRLDRGRAPVRVGLFDQCRDTGDLWRRHRRAGQVLKLFITNAVGDIGGLPGQDIDAGRDDIGLQDVGHRMVWSP